MYQASGSARSASPGIACVHAPVSPCRGQNWGPPEAGLSTDALADVTAGHAWMDARLGGGALPFPLLGEKDAEETKLLTGMAQQMEEWARRQTDAVLWKKESLTLLMYVSFYKDLGEYLKYYRWSKCPQGYWLRQYYQLFDNFWICSFDFVLTILFRENGVSFEEKYHQWMWMSTTSSVKYAFYLI